MTVKSSELKYFEKRKRDHIELALLDKNQCLNKDINSCTLIHEALPDLNFSEVDISVDSLADKHPSPFFVSSMTAGHQNSININEVLATAASEMGWAMGVGSQRRELTDKQASLEWQKIRKKIPNVILYSNIGIAQAITHSPDEILQLCENLQAGALFIHCNPLQECIQPEGTPQFSRGLEAIALLSDMLPIPIIIKETGCGFSQTTLERLTQTKISAVDVSGLGGTHWGRVEGDRANSNLLKQTADSFKHWGISTIQSLINANIIKPKYECWASGGVRNGVDAAKYLALGANRIGVAKPMLEAALVSTEKVVEVMQTFEYELRTALFCTGSKTIKTLRDPKKWQITI